MTDSEPPNTERDPVTNEAIMAELRQVKEAVLSLSGAVVELNKTVRHHLESHDHDAKRTPSANGDGAHVQ